jgi:hypothetical protein
MNQDNGIYLIYYVWMIVAAMLGSAHLIEATEKEGIAIAGGVIIFLALWFGLRSLGYL